LDPKLRVTPTIRLLSDVAVRSFRGADERDVVSTPPRTGKSQTAVIWNAVWMLMENPDLKIVVVAYGDDLSQTHSREARKTSTSTAVPGVPVGAGQTEVGRWRVEGLDGGLLAAGINSGVTGFGADCLLIDDSVKGQSETDSKSHRKRILNEYRSTLAPRVHPGGSLVVIQTRWHEEDLAGSLLKQEPEVWRHTNIPAVSEVGVPDALGRPPGVAMISALGFTPEHYAAMRRTSGSGRGMRCIRVFRRRRRAVW